MACPPHKVRCECGYRCGSREVSSDSGSFSGVCTVPAPSRGAHRNPHPSHSRGCPCSHTPFPTAPPPPREVSPPAQPGCLRLWAAHCCGSVRGAEYLQELLVVQIWAKENATGFALAPRSGVEGATASCRGPQSGCPGSHVQQQVKLWVLRCTWGDWTGTGGARRWLQFCRGQGKQNFCERRSKVAVLIKRTSMCKSRFKIGCF